MLCSFLDFIWREEFMSMCESASGDYPESILLSKYDMAPAHLLHAASIALAADLINFPSSGLAFGGAGVLLVNILLAISPAYIKATLRSVIFEGFLSFL